MKKQAYSLVVMLLITATARGQIDYSKYDRVFYDDFTAYANPSGPFPATDFSSNPSSPYYAPFHANWTTDKGFYGETTKFKDFMVTMSSYGIIKLTEWKYGTSFVDGTKEDGSPRYVDHYSGAITTTKGYGYGVFEAEMQISNDDGSGGANASSAFWTNPAGGRYRTELDIIDAAEKNYIPVRVIDYSYSPQHSITQNYIHATDLSAGFHLYSCQWDPEMVRWFIDGVEIRHLAFDEMRTYDNFQSLSIALNALPSTVGNFSMYVKSVKVWKKKCTSSDLNILDVTSSVPPSGTQMVKPGLYKYAHIFLNYPSKHVVLPYGPKYNPVIFEAESTTIESNFDYDNSAPLVQVLYSVPVDNLSPLTTKIPNAFLEIRPLTCFTEVNNNDWFRPLTGSPNDNMFGAQADLLQGASEAGESDGGQIGVSSTQVSLSGTRIDGGPQGTLNTENIAAVAIVPNPASESATLTFGVSRTENVSIVITNALGQEYNHILDMYERTARRGQHSVKLNTSEIPSGVYYVRIQIGNQMVVKKLTVL